MAIGTTRELSLRQWLVLPTMITSGIGVLLGCLCFLAYDMHVAKEHREEDLRSVADLISTNSTAALVFDDAIGASKILEGLSTRNHIRLGVLYRSDGIHFASYVRADLKGNALPPDRAPDAMVWTSNRLTYSSPVLLGRRKLGRLYLESDLTDLREQLRRFEQLTALMRTIKPTSNGRPFIMR